MTNEPKAETHSIPKDQVAPHEQQRGKPLPNRRERRRWAREAARQLNRGRRQRIVAVAPDEDAP